MNFQGYRFHGSRFLVQGYWFWDLDFEILNLILIIWVPDKKKTAPEDSLLV